MVGPSRAFAQKPQKWAKVDPLYRSIHSCNRQSNKHTDFASFMTSAECHVKEIKILCRRMSLPTKETEYYITKNTF